MKITKQRLREIIEEEYYIDLIKEEWKYSQWGRNPDGSERTREEWARHVLQNPDQYDRSEVYDAQQLEKEGFPPHRDEFVGVIEPARVSSPVRDSPDDLARIALAWESFIDNTSRENIPQAIATLRADGRLSGKYQGQTILPILKTLYQKLRNYEQHA